MPLPSIKNKIIFVYVNLFKKTEQNPKSIAASQVSEGRIDKKCQKIQTTYVYIPLYSSYHEKREKSSVFPHKSIKKWCYYIILIWRNYVNIKRINNN